ncbi:unnamed protein product, partial [Rotaria magnacalcarata]
IHQLDWSWIQACEHEAAGNLEQAAYEYKLLLNEHFKSLSMINEKQKEDKISAMETPIDINAIRADEGTSPSDTNHSGSYCAPK